MSDLLQQYKAYYKTRASRFAGNSKYSNSFKAESDLANAMISCNELSEFKDKIGDLNEKCAIALVQDEHLLEQAFFNKHQEVVRVEIANRILEKLSNVSDTGELITMVNNVSTDVMIEISVDEANRLFQYEWGRLDKIDIYENAEVPGEYKSKLKEWAEEERQKLIQAVTDEEDNSNKFKSGWKYTPDVNLEHRHRRLIPYSDQHLNEQLAKYKSIVNR